MLLLLGRSTPGREAARSHTGSVVADQDLLGARLEELGIWLADSITEQARIVALLRSFGRPDPAKGAFVITASGGGATLTADAAERNGAVLAPLTGGHGRHPAQPSSRPARTPATRSTSPPATARAASRPVYDAVAADPTVGILVEPYVLPWPDESEGHRWHRDALERLADAAAETGVDVAVISTFEQEPNDWITGYASRRNVSVTCGLEDTMKALGKLYGVSGARPNGVGGPRARRERLAPRRRGADLRGRGAGAARGGRLRGAARRRRVVRGRGRRARRGPAPAAGAQGQRAGRRPQGPHRRRRDRRRRRGRRARRLASHRRQRRGERHAGARTASRCWWPRWCSAPSCWSPRYATPSPARR